MIIIETNKRTLEEALDYAKYQLSRCKDIDERMYCEGIIQALLWIRDGGNFWGTSTK